VRSTNPTNSSVASPKFWEGSKILTLSKQQYLIWVTASQSTKQQDMLEIYEGMSTMAPPWLPLWHTTEFQKATHCHAKYEFDGLIKDKNLQLKFSKQTWCHFWIRTRNEFPVISDLAIYTVHKLLAFCTTFCVKQHSQNWQSTRPKTVLF